jgi:peroxiredoxin-like protein
MMPRSYTAEARQGATCGELNPRMMHPFPHRYAATGYASPDGDVTVESDGLPALATAPPAEFGGPGDRWSPETLLMGAVADCFILTFRALAKASSMQWIDLSCSAEGVLDRVDRQTRFTEIHVQARLRVPSTVDEDKAMKLLERAEHLCLITNSLSATAHLDAKVEVTAEEGANA